jgi:putative phage-type endonuclease
MSAILKLVQGTNEWHEHRAKNRNASETPAVLGVSPFQTPHQLWLLRTGRAKQPVTFAMRRGTELEGPARVAYEARTGLVMEPLVLQDGEYSASLDGITLSGDQILEIKCPMKGRDSELWLAAEAGSVPEHYGWQIEHQLMVSGAQLAHLWVFDGEHGVLVEVPAQPVRWPVIHAAWDQFFMFLGTDTPPPLMSNDIRNREDETWRTAAEKYRLSKQQAEEYAAILEAAKSELLKITSHPRETGCGVTVTQFWKRGAIDYKAVPTLKGMDLDAFRGPSRLECRVSVDSK